MQKIRLWLLLALVQACIVLPAFAHHVLGRPSYSLSEDSNTPPSMQVETQIGKFFVTYMVFPAFPRANEPGRVNLYATRIDNGEPYAGQVSFSVKDDSWFSSDEEILGTQPIDAGVFRQGFQFNKDGDYIITARFEADGEPYVIDFPLTIGDTASSTPITVSVIVIVLFLAGINIIKRKQLLRAKIRADRTDKHA
ncbi:FIG00921845: hypothetical protein [hydrothermal vent metagenome]|uniref:YtkA-like domain-containing protein n=2 Tax=hydrothermal vent metagenome TaxID=652676 RepID=A0A3B1AQN1_9ZZZZ